MKLATESRRKKLVKELTTPQQPTALDQFCTEIRTGPFSILSTAAQDRLILLAQLVAREAYHQGHEDAQDESAEQAEQASGASS